METANVIKTVITISYKMIILRKKLDNAGLKDFITTRFGVGYIV